MARIKKKIENNFTVVHNAYLNDSNLGIDARGLLTTMLSKPEYTKDGKHWNFSIRGLAAELPDGKQKIQTTLNELEERGYLMRNVITDSKGRFVDTEYIFSDEIMPEAIEAYAEKQKAKKKKSAVRPNPVSPCPENRDTDNRDTEKPYPVKSDNNKIRKNKIQKEKIRSDKVTIDPSPANPDCNLENSSIDMNDKIDKSQERKEYREAVEFLVKQNIEYEWYEEYFTKNPDNSMSRGKATYASSMNEINMLVEIIVDTICSEKEHIRIGKEDMYHSIVENRFKKLEMKHIEYAFKCLMLNTKDIKNPVAYLRTVLYNASITCDFAESNELKNYDPAMFIPEQFHNEEFKNKYYEHTAFIPKSVDW